MGWQVRFASFSGFRGHHGAVKLPAANEPEQGSSADGSGPNPEAQATALLVRCTVRACGGQLKEEGAWGCDRGHRFDRAREGYVNLLQPQDSRSKHPGDPPETVAARARVAESGAEAALIETVAGWVDTARLPGGAAVLDVGCGTGELLARLALQAELDAYGTDLTVRALRIAARRTPPPMGSLRWFASNADRGLPFPDDALDLVISIKAPKPTGEFARVLRPGGRALIATPAIDDLIELRTQTAGGALARDPAKAVLTAAQQAGLTLVSSLTVRTRRALPAELSLDLLMTGYRGLRRSERSRLSTDGTSLVTLATVLQVFEAPPKRED